MKHHKARLILFLSLGLCAALLLTGTALAEEDGLMSLLRRYSGKAAAAAIAAEPPDGLQLSEREAAIYRLGYAAGFDHEEASIRQSGPTTYVLNTNTHKFHEPNCSSVSQIKDRNRREYGGTRQSLIDLGYSPCSICKP